jgi:hypothetical protein
MIWSIVCFVVHFMKKKNEEANNVKNKYNN